MEINKRRSLFACEVHIEVIILIIYVKGHFFFPKIKMNECYTVLRILLSK